MDLGNFKKLNGYHVVFLIQNVMTGVALLSLPNYLKDAGYMQWIIPILLGIFMQVTIFPMIKLCQLYPNDNLHVISERIMGKWLGKIVTIVLIFYAVIEVAAVSDGYIRLVQAITLPMRDIFFPLLALFIVMLYVVNGGIKSIARFSIFAFFATGWMVYYLQWPIQKGTFLHFLPIFQSDLSGILKALNKGFLAIIGYELIMVYFPYIVNQRKAYKHASIGIWITVFFYLLVSAASIVYFSHWQLSNVLYPALNIFKSVELTFIERIENFGISLWVFLIISTGSAYLWSAKRGMDSLFTNKRTFFLYIVAVIAFSIVRGPLPTFLKEFLIEKLSIYLFLVVVFYPNILLIIHWLRKKAVKANG